MGGEKNTIEESMRSCLIVQVEFIVGHLVYMFLVKTKLRDSNQDNCQSHE